jgi:transcriptional regulator with XRE-family HTH domain
MQPELGRRLRALRRDRGLSLASVASATGISTSALSLVETGRSDVTLARVVVLARFYGRSIVDLLPEPTHEPHVVRADERRRLDSSTEGVEILLLAPSGSRTMQPYIVVHQHRAETREYTPHVGECFMHVLEGTVEIAFDTADDEPPIQLGPGDSAYYATERRHFVRNIGEGQARTLGVLTPPAF